MNWFQRYGIPGAYFWGLSVLWMFVLFPCEISNINIETTKIIAGVAGATFLPIGYLISILQQIIYLWSQKPWLGMTGRAIRESALFENTNEREYLLEAEACLFVMSKKHNVTAANKPVEHKPDVESQKFFQDWIRNRNNVMAINLSIIITTILVIVIVFLVPKYCLKWQLQIETRWIIFVIVVSIFVVITSFCSWYILREEVVRVEAVIYKIAVGQCGTKLVLKEKPSGKQKPTQDNGK